MKFQQYLTEKVYTKEEFKSAIDDMNNSNWVIDEKKSKKFDMMMKDIKKNCKQIIKVYQKTYDKELSVPNSRMFLFRGMYGLEDYFGKLDAIKDRKPKDTRKWIHDKLDDAFEDLFDIRPRSSGTFCSGDLDMANNYGSVNYVIFPFDKFDFIWSKTVRDLYVSAQGGKAEDYLTKKKEQENLNYTYDDFSEYRDDGKTDNKQLEKVYNDYLHTLIEKDYILNGNLIDAIQKGNEIMVICDKYYAMKVDYVKYLMPLILK